MCGIDQASGFSFGQFVYGSEPLTVGALVCCGDRGAASSDSVWCGTDLLESHSKNMASSLMRPAVAWQFIPICWQPSATVIPSSPSLRQSQLMGHRALSLDVLRLAGRQTDRLGSDINAHLAHAACRVATARVCKVHRHAPVAPDRVSNAWGYPGRGAQHAGAGGRWQRLLVCLSVCAVVTPVVVVVVVVVPSLWAWSKSMPVSAPSGPGGRWADQTGIPAVRGPQDGSETKQGGE